MIFKLKLKERQRPVKIRDGKGGEMLRVTADEWVTFKGFSEVPDFIEIDTTLEIEIAPEITITPAPAAVVSESPPPAAKPAKRRRGRPPKKKAPEPEAEPVASED